MEKKSTNNDKDIEAKEKLKSERKVLREMIFHPNYDMDNDEDYEKYKKDVDRQAFKIYSMKKKEKERKTLNKEKESLCPVFADDIKKSDFSLSKLIRVAEMDKKHSESIACKGSIGCEEKYNGFRVIRVYPDMVSAFGLSLYPDMNSEVYYVNPVNSNSYISLDEYFNYLRIARISELQKIALDLGAKHFRVTYKEHEKTYAMTNVKAKVGGKVGRKGGSAEASHESSSSNYAKAEIAAEMTCDGHDPVEPLLQFFAKDPQIQSLVSMRMQNSGLKHHTYTLALDASSGLKEKDAAKIDVALAAMKIEGHATVTSEAQSEARRVFEYEIDF